MVEKDNHAPNLKDQLDWCKKSRNELQFGGVVIPFFTLAMEYARLNLNPTWKEMAPIIHAVAICGAALSFVDGVALFAKNQEIGRIERQLGEK